MHGLDVKLEETTGELERAEEQIDKLKNEGSTLRELLTLALTDELQTGTIQFGYTPDGEVVVATLGNVTFTVDPEDVCVGKGWNIVLHITFTDGYTETLSAGGPGPWIRTILFTTHSDLMAGGLHLGGAEVYIFVGSPEHWP